MGHVLLLNVDLGLNVENLVWGELVKPDLVGGGEKIRWNKRRRV